MKKCKFPDGMIIKPDGIHELDPCIYKEGKKYRNVTICIYTCKNCGHKEILWTRQEDTEEIDSDE